MSCAGSAVEFVCGEMLLDLGRMSRLVLAWPGELCTTKI